MRTSGDIMSTSVHWRYHEYIGGYHEYTSGDIMMHVGGYHEYIRACSVHRGDPMSTSGDIMSTSGGIMSTSGGCSVHQGDIMSTSGDVQFIRVFNRN